MSDSPQFSKRGFLVVVHRIILVVLVPKTGFSFSFFDPTTRLGLAVRCEKRVLGAKTNKAQQWTWRNAFSFYCMKPRSSPRVRKHICRRTCSLLRSRRPNPEWIIYLVGGIIRRGDWFKKKSVAWLVWSGRWPGDETWMQIDQIRKKNFVKILVHQRPCKVLLHHNTHTLTQISYLLHTIKCNEFLLAPSQLVLPLQHEPNQT